MVHSSTDRNTKKKNDKIKMVLLLAPQESGDVSGLWVSFVVVFFLTLVLFTCRRDQRNKRVASLGPGPKNEG